MIRKHKKTIGVTLLFLVVVTSVVLWKIHSTDHSSNKMKIVPVAVKTTTLKEQNQTLSESASGYLSAKEDTSITPRVSGYIKAISLPAGATTKKNQILFQLDNMKEKEALTAAKAAAALSVLQYQRDKKLLAKGFVTQEAYYQSKVTMQQKNAALLAAKTNLDNMTITAPFKGTISGINASLGGYVTPGEMLTHLVNTLNLTLRYTLPAKDLNKIALGQPVTIQGEAENTPVIGRVTYISPSIDKDTQTITLHATIKNTKHIFKPGEFVTVLQHIGVNHHALLIPEQSIIGSMSGYSVFLVKNNKAIATQVKIGRHFNGKILIKSGLKPGDVIITAGQDELHNDQVISAIPSKSQK